VLRVHKKLENWCPITARVSYNRIVSCIVQHMLTRYFAAGLCIGEYKTEQSGEKSTPAWPSPLVSFGLKKLKLVEYELISTLSTM
jgi:hypothetical protein